MTVIAEWANLEAFINDLFMSLSGAERVSAAAIFTTIRSQAGQRDAIKAALAASGLPEDTKDIVLAALEFSFSASDTRNRLCHWIWGHSDDLPDAVLLADPMASLKWENSSSPDPEKEKRSRIFAYRVEDFSDASARLQRAMKFIAQLRFLVAGTGDPYSAEKLRQLSSEPEIQKWLDRQRRRDR